MSNNSDNIHPHSSEIAREYGRRGGLAKGRNNAKHRELRERMLALLEASMTDKTGKVRTNPITGEEMDYYEAMLVKQVAAAANGNQRAAEFCLRVAGLLEESIQQNTLIVMQQRTPEDAYAAAYGVIDDEAGETTTEEKECEN